MSMNMFFEVVDPQKLDECIENNGDVEELLSEHSLKSTDTAFWGYDFMEILSDDEDMGRLFIGSGIEVEDAPMGACLFDNDDVKDIADELSTTKIKQVVSNFVTNSGGDKKEIENELIGTLEDIKELFEFAQQENKVVVMYVG